jgi:hypothetical protein
MIVNPSREQIRDMSDAELEIASVYHKALRRRPAQSCRQSAEELEHKIGWIYGGMYEARLCRGFNLLGRDGDD